MSDLLTRDVVDMQNSFFVLGLWRNIVPGKCKDQRKLRHRSGAMLYYTEPIYLGTQEPVTVRSRPFIPSCPVFLLGE